MSFLVLEPAFSRSRKSVSPESNDRSFEHSAQTKKCLTQRQTMSVVIAMYICTTLTCYCWLRGLRAALRAPTKVSCNKTTNVALGSPVPKALLQD